MKQNSFLKIVLNSVCVWIIFVPGLNFLSKDVGLSPALSGILCFAAVVGLFSISERFYNRS